MPTRHWIVNASPLILLGKIGRLDLLVKVAGGAIIIPQAVFNEAARRHEEAAIVDFIHGTTGCRIEPDVVAPPEVAAWDLGGGETQVIALALALGCERMVLDDKEARRCAKTFRLASIGTLGLVGRAKRLGIIDKAHPVIEQLRRSGLYLSDDLLNRILDDLEEAVSPQG